MLPRPDVRPAVRPRPGRGLRASLGAAARKGLPAGVVLLLAGTLLTFGVAGSAQARNAPQPGDFRGRAFDQCEAPSQRAMNSWLLASPFQAVGIYISGKQRACREQRNLTPTWVRNQINKGWHLLPITLGPQPHCNPRFPRYGEPDMNRNPANRYQAARSQGWFEGNRAVIRAKELGIEPGSTLFYDLEGFDTKVASCRLPALAFIDGWVQALHRKGQFYNAGVYSSAGTGMNAIFAEKNRPSSYKWRMPDQVWIADWDHKMNLHSQFLDRTSWLPGNRIKQYRGGHNERWGGTTINIDSNWMQVGKAIRPAPDLKCGKISVSRPVYYALARGTGFTGQVQALQCLLQKKGWYDGPLDGRYDQDVIDAANRFLRTVNRPINVPFSWADWTALLSDGRTPTVKMYSREDGVRDLQRALNAAMRVSLTVNGTFDTPTRKAVVAYQRKVGLTPNGHATPATWRKLNAGSR